MDFSLTDGMKKTLLAAAREIIASRLEGRDARLPSPEGVLTEVCGAFVTLHRKGMLRGCIGNIVGIKPLFTTVTEMAEASAFGDPRFPPLAADEYPEISIEISVLSPLERIASIDKIETGVHGIFMRRGFRSGVLLPQVPVEQGWDRDTFVRHTCIKAGLPEDAWKDPATEISIFSAVVFSEDQFTA